GLPGAAAGPGGPRGGGAGEPARLPQPPAGGGDDTAGRRRLPGTRAGSAVPGALARGTGSALAEGDVGDGRAALPKPRDGAQGVLGTPAGLQPGPRGAGAGGAGPGGAAPGTEFQGRGAGRPGLRRAAVRGRGADGGGTLRLAAHRGG